MSEIIQDLSLEDVIGDRFGRYSKYIIQERALPDVRDGLKPVQRRILYAMYSSGNTYDKNFRKVQNCWGCHWTISSSWRFISILCDGTFKSRLEITSCTRRNAW